MTMQVESRLGAAYITLMSLFFIGLIFIALKNFNSDVAIVGAEQAHAKTISNTERALIENWVKEKNIELPEREGFRYLIKRYPDKPWIR